MSWTQVFALCLLSTLLVLTGSGMSEGAAVGDHAKRADPTGVAKQVFMPESDASTFFKRRGRRWADYYAELRGSDVRGPLVFPVYSPTFKEVCKLRMRDAEQRVRLGNNERRKEYSQEQRDEYETYLEEERSAQNERWREKNEQFREFHHDGTHPRYYWFH